VRIWYQSFTDWDHHSAYLGRLQRLLEQIASPGIDVTVGGLRPADLAVHPVSELRCSVQVLDHLCAAQEDGYDAAIIGHFQDPQLDAARAMLDIPVVGLGESSMLHSLQLGRRFGLVTIHSTYLEWHREQAIRLGLADRLVGVEALSVSPALMVEACADPDAYAGLRDVFVTQARKLVATGAEVIISAGGLFALLSAHERRFLVDGAVVLNPIPVALRTAETAAWLRAYDGTEPSRTGIYAKPPEQAVAELRSLANGRLAV
jgi:allantoin racemase